MRAAIFLLLAIVIAAIGGRNLWQAQIADPIRNGPVSAALQECSLPLPTDAASMIFAGYYEGAAISTTRLVADNEEQEPTTVVDVEIAPGLKPLYILIVGARASVLRFSGWTRRVEKLIVVTDRRYPTAVVGLPQARTIFADRNRCAVDSHQLYGPGAWLPPTALSGVVKRPQPAHLTNEERQRRPLYRMPDVIGGAYEPAVLRIGYGSVRAQEYPPHEHSSSLADWEKIGADFAPAGVKEVDVGSLIAPVRAEPYEVLPAWAGLGQLVRDGKLVDQGLGVFKVLAPIRVPVGLEGAQAVTFEVAPGVPPPTGDLGHSKIR